MAMPERFCAYRAHAKHREIHNQRLIKSPPRPDYQQLFSVNDRYMSRILYNNLYDVGKITV